MSGRGTKDLGHRAGSSLRSPVLHQAIGLCNLGWLQALGHAFGTRPRAGLAALRRQAMKDGMRPLRLAGAMKVAEGLTTLEEVLRSTPSLER